MISHNFNHPYKNKMDSIENIFKNISFAKKIVLSMGASEPKGFLNHLSRVSKNPFNDALIYCANPSESYPCFSNTTVLNSLKFGILFLTDKVRNLQGNEHVHYIPSHLSKWVKNLTAYNGGIDVFWGSCTPPDERGFVSLGPSNCYESEIIRNAKTIILEINPNLPLTFGDTHFQVNKVDYFVSPDCDQSLPQLKKPDIGLEDRKIASYIGELIPDGSTLQLGIGSIPNAIGEALSSKKNLGIHTEMINDTMMDLFYKGVITGERKTIWPGKMIGAFAYGTKELYQFLDKNPIVELQPASVVNDPYRMGRNHKMISVNTAVEIDLTGQVCSESLGHMELSGVGGAFDTHTGAQRSEGGMGIIAIKSTTKAGKSKIGLSLMEGAKISISRNDIDTIVTEYGVARLLGKSVMERAKSLISIAHPKFRDELLHLAKKFKYI